MQSKNTLSLFIFVLLFSSCNQAQENKKGASRVNEQVKDTVAKTKNLATVLMISVVF